jgi:hypothetical protein
MKQVQLKEELQKIATAGIQADDAKLKKDMISQFENPLLYARELVVNSYDAEASRVEIRGQVLQDDLISVTYADNGSGMDRKAIINYTSIFSSYKHSAEAAIGTHGIGKLAVMKVPGLRRFSLITSTGQEAWQFHAKDLIANDPITIHQIDPAFYQKGTTIEIVFETSKTLREEMLAIKDILSECVRYLPLDTLVWIPDEHTPVRYAIHIIRQPWKASGAYARIYLRQSMGLRFEFQLSVNNNAESELYQKYVLIEKIPLVINDHVSFQIPHLAIRVNCNDFELPFGRHRIMNEESIVDSISCILLNDILPDYFQFICKFTEYKKGERRKRRFLSLPVLEEVAAGLLHASAQKGLPWTRFPLFLTKNYERISFERLETLVNETGILYLDSPDNTGVDYSSFTVPVLSHMQPPAVIEIVNKYFSNNIINLALSDIVIESPNTPVLTPDEKLLQDNLSFDPRLFYNQFQFHSTNNKPAIFNLSDTVENNQAADDLADLEWKVNYLLERDGRTPCISRRFITKQSIIILNLNHQDVRMLCQLSKRDPLLAGHLGLEMVISEGAMPFNHLTSEVKDNLILMDAILKCGYEPDKTSQREEKISDKLREFLRNISDEHLGLL